MSLSLTFLRRIWLQLFNILKAFWRIKNLFWWAVRLSSLFFASFWWLWRRVFLNLRVETIWLLWLRKNGSRLQFLWLCVLRMKCGWSQNSLSDLQVLWTGRRIEPAVIWRIKRSFEWLFFVNLAFHLFECFRHLMLH